MGYYTDILDEEPEDDMEFLGRSYLPEPQSMKPEIKAEWLKRLRGGEIPQGKAYLGAVNGERCCLGVLCDIAVEQGVIEVITRTDVQNDPYAGKGIHVLEYDATIPGSGQLGTLPYVVQQWAGLTQDNPDVLLEGDSVSSLAEMNDEGYTFAQIADVIEERF